MIFLRKKKRSFIGSGSPSEIKYQELVEKYGSKVEVSFGRKIFPSGKQFVRDAKTNRIYELTDQIKYLGTDKSGFHFYLHEDHELKAGDLAHPSFVK